MSKFSRFLPILLIIALTLTFFFQVAFTDKILARGDTYNYFYPLWDARNSAFRAGELPLWTPDLFMGAPLLANPQLGTYYPPNWITAPLRAPDAIRISILLHVALAGIGVFGLYRATISEEKLPALVAGGIFAFGGYLGSHVEQINQLQGLAWMPILLWLYHRLLAGNKALQSGLWMLMAWALQIFSGHTQTVFMTGVLLGIYGLGISIQQWRETGKKFQPIRAMVLLGIVGLGAVLLAIPQLLPTLELTGMSNRGGGFSAQQATAFSLSPTTIGRALLPSYDSQLFGEYVTYLGIIGLGMALWGAIARASQHKWIWITIAGIGLLLAFGRYNPLYLLLAELPGFNLFRVPARWLSLFSLGMAILGGMGIQALLAGQRPSRRFVAILTLILAMLIFLTRFVLKINPDDVYGSITPTDTSLILWLISLGILLAVLLIQHRHIPKFAAGFILLELFLASLILPYNDLTPPEVYLGQRFTISQLLAKQADEIVPGRTLSISRLYFDPGDISALRERYSRIGLDERSQFIAFDAVKKQEMLMPNLPLSWGIPTVDGFDGGVLPTIYYSQFASLFLPQGELRTIDGRLGEILAKPECRGACIPKIDWLIFTDTRYIITDKIYDVWFDDVTYDTAMADFWQTTEELGKPDFDFDEVRILHTAPLDSDSQAEEIQDGLLITKTDWESFQEILKSENSIIAVTLVDTRTKDVFLQIQPPRLERILSSDVKIYQTTDYETRAYIPPLVEVLPDNWQGHEDALEILKSGQAWVIHGDAEPRNTNDENVHHWLDDATNFVSYTPTYVEIKVNYKYDAYLILSDAYYPGWKATVNGEPVLVYRANVMFRAVPIPKGESRVIFYFQPDLWIGALVAGVFFWLIIFALLILARQRS